MSEEHVHEHDHPGHEEALNRFNELKDVKPVRQGEFLGEEQEKFYVALSEEEVYELSPLAYYIWVMCDGEHTVNELAESISKEAQVDFKDVIEPLVMALDQLHEAKLVNY
ncbi:MAG: PqqD family protein [Desulfurococcus sp.]|jgi:2-keto-3-deoxy-L-rhamnonate aldolase RhmA|uniref:PqqD family protein n=1 Tax=Desulfurococcus sp. TaxID=51678 RepID=UPI00315F02FF